MTELSVLDLERETVELLPHREALGRKKGHHHYHSSTVVAIATNVSVVEQNATAVAISDGHGDAFAAAGNFSYVEQNALALAIND